MTAIKHTLKKDNVTANSNQIKETTEILYAQYREHLHDSCVQIKSFLHMLKVSRPSRDLLENHFTWH